MSFDDIVQAPLAAESAASKADARRAVTKVGGPPRVSLLPPEVRDAARIRSSRLVLIGAVTAAFAAAAGATLVAGGVAGAASDRAAQSGDRTQTLLGQVAKFSDVAALTNEIAVARAASAVGASTAVDWRAQYDALVGDMPYGYTVSGINADSASAVAAYSQGDSPLERPRVGTIVLTVKGPKDTSAMSPWIRKIRAISAYADASTSWSEGSAAQGSSGAAGSTLTITVHIGREALVNQKAASK